MSRRRIALVYVMCMVLLSSAYLGAQSPKPVPLRNQVTVTHDVGMNVIDFETMQGPAKLYLPDDLVAGEQFSGQIRALPRDNATSAFVLEGAAGQKATTSEKNFVWRVPAEDAGRGITFILRSPNYPTNDELARVQVPVLSQAPSLRPLLGFTNRDSVVPPIVQSGA